MTKTIKKLLSAALLVPAMVLTVGVVAQPAHAAFDKGLSDGASSAQGKDQQGDAASLFGDGGQGGIFRTITNVMLFLIGAISVIMLIVGGSATSYLVVTLLPFRTQRTRFCMQSSVLS